MKELLLLGLFVWCGLISAESDFVAKVNYVVTLPDVLYAGRNAEISVVVFDGPTRFPVFVKLLDGSKEVASEKVSRLSVVDSQAAKVQRGVLTLQVPDNLEVKTYKLQVGGGDRKQGFLNTTTVEVINAFSIFITSDRPIYKPGQTVYFQILVLDADLKPRRSGIVAEIRDPNGNIIYRFDRNTDDFGIVALDVPIANEVPLGDWTINVQAESEKQDFTFTIDQFTLPRFSLKITTDPLESFNATKVRGVVTAQYTFGEPVRGELRVTLYRQQYWLFKVAPDGPSSNNNEFSSVFIENFKGKATFELPIPVNQDNVMPPPRENAPDQAFISRSFFPGSYQVEASLQEEATGIVINETSDVSTNPSSAEFTITSPSRSFKPGLPVVVSILGVWVIPPAGLRPNEQGVYVYNKQVNLTINVPQVGSKTKIIQFDPRTGRSFITIDTFPLKKQNEYAEVAVSLESSEGFGYLSIPAAYSPTNSFISVSSQIPPESSATSENLISFSDTTSATFNVLSKARFSVINYQVISPKGEVIISESIKAIKRANRDGLYVTPIVVKISQEMSPRSTLLVYAVVKSQKRNGDDELIADSVQFDITWQLDNFVNVKFNTEEAQPGAEVRVSVDTTASMSIVGLSIVDSSVSLLSSRDTHLTVSEVLSRLQGKFADDYYYYNSLTPKEVIMSAHLILLTNLKLTQPELKVFVLEAQAGGGDVPPVPPVARGAFAPVSRVRSFFPETWISRLLVTSNDGTGSFTTNAPDSITTWNVHAFAISQQRGLGLPRQSVASQLRVFQPFFVSVILPESAIRGEEVVVTILVSNYVGQNLQVQVELALNAGGSQFEFVDQNLKGQNTVIQTINIEDSQSDSVSFVVKPVSLGLLSIKATARSSVRSDAVEQTIMVEAEGVPTQIVTNYFISSGRNQDFTLSTTLPQGVEAVPDSVSAVLSVVGDILASALSNIDKLLAMPYGCGEQNMVILAPNVFISRYLVATNRFKTDVKNRAIGFMESGYQRELTFLRSDGSYSAFGESDSSGSLWLTAFVVRIFSMVGFTGDNDVNRFIFVDPSLLKRNVEWILSYQKPSGSFPQVGQILDTFLLGGLYSQNKQDVKAPLTAFVVMALVEYRTFAQRNFTSKHQEALKQATSYLENWAKKTTSKNRNDVNIYGLALVSYALTLVKSSMAKDALNFLLTFKTSDGENVYIDPTQYSEANSRDDYYFFTPSPAVIETTAYALLTLLQQQNVDLPAALPYARWLVQQRNQFGGFSSTQDTVVALQALTSYAQLTYSSNANLRLNIQASSRQFAVMTVSSTNFDILQQIELPINQQYIMSVTGQGTAVGQLLLKYNLPANGRSASFDFVVRYTTSRSSPKKAKVEVSISSKIPETGMVVAEVGLFSGFIADSSSLDLLLNAENRLVKRYDLEPRKVNLYFDSVPNDGTSLKVQFDIIQEFQVTNLKPALSVVYSYYDPNRRAAYLATLEQTN